MPGKTCIVIAGPTAAGKTNLSLQLAAYFNTDIISADSRQCYRELNIGVAKPGEKDLSRIRHYFINSHSIHEEVNAAVFEKYALEAAWKIFAEKDYAVMVGGTGLYIKAFCEGLDDVPPVDGSVRRSLRAGYAANGIGWLQEMIRENDPLFYEKGEMLNPHRMLRALEVKKATGKSILEWHSMANRQRPFNIIRAGIELPRTLLYEQINKRVDTMMEAGLLEEAKALERYRHRSALQTVGYTELFEYIDGKFSLEEAVDRIKKNTRHYAKRQLTWFKKDPGIRWFAPDDTEHITGFIDRMTSPEQRTDFLK